MKIFAAIKSWKSFWLKVSQKFKLKSTFLNTVCLTFIHQFTFIYCAHNSWMGIWWSELSFWCFSHFYQNSHWTHHRDRKDRILAHTMQLQFKFSHQHNDHIVRIVLCYHVYAQPVVYVRVQVIDTHEFVGESGMRHDGNN